jgi:ABC-2 type transport system ATP-binding protein
VSDVSAGSGTDPAVVITRLVKRYGAVTAVDHLDLTVPYGSVTAVLGPNGAGKTTTIECAEGFRRPDSGAVRVLGEDPHARRSGLSARIGVMLQESSGGYPGARAVEMLRHVAGLYAHPLDVDALVQRLALDEAGRTTVRRLSGGLRQRLSLAMAVVGRPELVFLDEPTAGLDPRSRRATWDLVAELRADGVTVVMTTHLLDEAERLADQVAIISRGRVVATGTPQELTGAEHEVRFTGRPRLDRTGLQTALPPGVVVDEPVSGRYVVSGAVDPQTLATVTAWCASHGVMPQQLTVGRRSLEDVFLAMTGEHATQSEGQP